MGSYATNNNATIVPRLSAAIFPNQWSSDSLCSTM